MASTTKSYTNPSAYVAPAAPLAWLGEFFRLNPAGERKVERFGWTFAPGDKVMQIENDYDKEVYNGDVGYIEDVDPDTGELIASFDGRPVTYGFGELDTLVPAYAATIHKSQG